MHFESCQNFLGICCCCCFWFKSKKNTGLYRWNLKRVVWHKCCKLSTSRRFGIIYWLLLRLNSDQDSGIQNASFITHHASFYFLVYQANENQLQYVLVSLLHCVSFVVAWHVCNYYLLQTADQVFLETRQDTQQTCHQIDRDYQ